MMAQYENEISVAEFFKQRDASDLEETFAGQVRQRGLPEPVRQLRFDPSRRWRFDFAWPAQMIAVEVDGGLYQAERTGHTNGAALERNYEKANAAALAGWTVLKGGPKMVKSGQLADDTRLLYARRVATMGQEGT